MSTRFTDISYDPLVYASYQSEQSIVSDALADSGIVVQNAALNERANGPSNITNIPTWNPLDASSEANHSNDDPDDLATPGKIDTKDQLARVAYLNNGWQAMDLLVEFSAADPMQAIAQRTGKYWRSQFQRRIVQMLNGILADNVANDSEDMVIDVATDSSDAITDAERISADVVIDALQTMGDFKGRIRAIAVHSAVHARLQKQNLIETVRNSDNNVMFETYLGKRLIVDDGLPAVAGTNRITYTSILLGDGAIGFGRGKPRVPNEVQRLPDAGGGGGAEALWERQTWLLHPLGFSFTSSSVAGTTPTWAELATAANWDRIFERKNIPLAFIQTNG